MCKPLKIFVAYSHTNATAKDELITRLALLKRDGMISIWHDNEILPGDRWRDNIDSNLQDSDLLLYLTSAHSLASENCNRELTSALNAKIKVIPIILEHCDWRPSKLSDFRVLPDNEEPLSEWVPADRGWQNVVDGIRAAIKGMQVQTESLSIPDRDRRLAEFMLDYGNFLVMLGANDKAFEAYSGAVRLNPHYVSAYNNRGNMHQERDDFEDAIRDYNKAIDLDPNHAKAYYNRGAAYTAKGEPDLAIKDCTTAIDLNSYDANAYNNRGQAYYERGDFEDAIRDYNRAIHLDRDHAIAYYNRGHIYLLRGEIDNAINDYETTIEILNNFAEAYNNLGFAYVNRGDFEKAIENYTKAIQLDPDCISFYFRCLPVQLFKGDWEGARACLNLAQDRGFDLGTEFRRVYGSVEDFEAKYHVQVPEDIAALLRQD